MLRLLAQFTLFGALVFLLRLPFAPDETAARAARVGAFDAAWARQVFPATEKAVGGPVPASTDLSGWRTHRSDDPKLDRAVAIPGKELRSDRREALRILQRKEEILRAHFENLRGEADDVERERSAVERALANFSERRDRGERAGLERRLSELGNIEGEIREAGNMLVSMSRDRERYEEWIRSSLPDGQAGLLREISPVPRDGVPRPLRPLQQRDESRRREIGERSAEKRPELFVLDWPVVPAEGLSAGFLDVSYEERFGLAHEAIDIPVEQGSYILAAADGVVIAVSDNGYGYNTIVLEHENGLQTLYGHVSQFLVAEGERVREGRTIALSGGRPGSRGAGFLTTGSHVHFETRLYGEAIDPLYFLPPMDAARSVANESVIPAM